MRTPSRMRGSAYGHVRHGLHAAGHRDVDVAGSDALRGQHHGPQPGSAHHVQCQRAHVSGRPAPSAACRAGACPTPAETTLPIRHSSTSAGSMAAAHERFTNGDGAELRRGEAFQRAKELAGGCTCGGENDRLLHLAIGCRTAGSGGRARQRADDALAEHALKAPEDERLRPLDLFQPLRLAVHDKGHACQSDAGRPGDCRPDRDAPANCTFSGVKGWFRRSAGSTRSARSPRSP